MMELDGSKYLTNEEMAVINAMRMGAEINAYFFNSSYDAAAEHNATLNGIVTMTLVRDLGEGENPKFDSYDMRIGQKIAIYHFIDK